MDNTSKKIGDGGEKMAKNYLINQGYEILHTNWRYKKYEIDLISKINNTIAFIEVKTRKNNIFGEPEIFVNKHKQKYLIDAAHQYLKEKNIELEARFDIIAIISCNGKESLTHLEAAFYPKIKFV